MINGGNILKPHGCYSNGTRGVFDKGVYDEKRVYRQSYKKIDHAE